MDMKQIGRYEIKSELGRGGMATVYRAWDPSFEREVAVKVLPREFLHDPQFTERFKREIKTIAALEHPAIVPVHDVGEEDGVPFFVMRYMAGGSLKDQMERGKFSVSDSARIIERLASALAYAHRKGVVHRDLKPDNILFDTNGDPFISDFGVASFASGPATGGLTGNAAIGTPAYMSPEQAQGDKVDNRSDIYALGVIIFQMLSGDQPYHAETPMATALKHITEPVPNILQSMPDLPEATSTIIQTAMAKKKEDRYPSALELARALREVATGLEGGVPASPSGAAESALGAGAAKSAASPLGSRTMLFVGIGAVAVIVIALFLLKGLSPSATATPPPAVGTSTTAITSDYFTEEFDGSLESWTSFVTLGQETPFELTNQNSNLIFALNGRGMLAYSLYTPKTYDNVRVDVKATNHATPNSNVILVCRYDETNGWYEFNIANNGLYSIRYGKWDKGKVSASYAKIADGATTKILTGTAVNEYGAVCKDHTLSLFINGSEIRSVDDTVYFLTTGSIGVGAQSNNQSPVEIWFDSLSVSKP